MKVKRNRIPTVETEDRDGDKANLGRLGLKKKKKIVGIRSKKKKDAGTTKTVYLPMDFELIDTHLWRAFLIVHIWTAWHGMA